MILYSQIHYIKKSSRSQTHSPNGGTTDCGKRVASRAVGTRAQQMSTDTSIPSRWRCIFVFSMCHAKNPTWSPIIHSPRNTTLIDVQSQCATAATLTITRRKKGAICRQQNARSHPPNPNATQLCKTQYDAQILHVAECDELMNLNDVKSSAYYSWQTPYAVVFRATMHTPFSSWITDYDFDKRVRGMIHEFLSTAVRTWRNTIPIFCVYYVFLGEYRVTDCPLLLVLFGTYIFFLGAYRVPSKISLTSLPLFHTTLNTYAMYTRGGM